jgi:NDP-sugar pyrophosphorylase family protein
MLVFIPMSGFGDRYRRAGYREPKPLIPVDGVPMIARILDGFPEDARFLFAVNRQHAEETAIVQTLEALRPQADIAVIEPHKDGPVMTVLAVADKIDDDEGVILNYCDFGVDWDYADFARWLDDRKFDGAMTAYRGFHPHSLGPTLYAYMRNEGDRVLEIREKHHFTPNKFDEFASSGLYYFRRGADLKRLSRELVERGQRVQGEFYVSMLMQLLIEQGGAVGVYPLKHFYQWGTPEDLRDYESWSRAMRSLDGFLTKTEATRAQGSLVLPAAGLGKRFSDRGYTAPKPLISVAGSPMIRQAIRTLPRSRKVVVVTRDEISAHPGLTSALSAFEDVEVVSLAGVTEGQACTTRIGLMREDGTPRVALDAPVTVASCDAGYVYDVKRFEELTADPSIDAIAITARGHLPAIWRPQMYGWVHAPDGRIQNVAVKQVVADVPVAGQEVITGTFWFRSGKLLAQEIDALVASGERVNNEFYVDTIIGRMVRRGANVASFAVDKYIPWGTPEELDTFVYWNDVFRGGRDV